LRSLGALDVMLAASAIEAAEKIPCWNMQSYVEDTRKGKEGELRT